MSSDLPDTELDDDELAETLRQAILASSGHRIADAYLAGVAAEPLGNRLRLEGLVVRRPGGA